MSNSIRNQAEGIILREMIYEEDAELKKVRAELRDLTVHTANYEELRDPEESNSHIF